MDAITGATTTSSTVHLIAWIRKIEDRVEMTEAIHYYFTRINASRISVQSPAKPNDGLCCRV